MDVWYSVDNLQEINFEEYKFRIELYNRYNGYKEAIYK